MRDHPRWQNSGETRDGASFRHAINKNGKRRRAGGRPLPDRGDATRHGEWLRVTAPGRPSPAGSCAHLAAGIWFTDAVLHGVAIRAAIPGAAGLPSVVLIRLGVVPLHT